MSIPVKAASAEEFEFDAELPADLVDGPAVNLDSSTPLHLDGIDSAWLITRGEVDFFVVPIDDDGNPGRRQHIGSAGAGCLLLGSDPLAFDGRSWRLLAVGVEALATPLSNRWRNRLPDSSLLQAGLFGWLTECSRNLTANGPRLAARTTEAAKPIDLTAGQVVDSAASLLWCVPETPLLAIGGRAQDVAFPVPLGEAWSVEVVATGKAAIRASVDIADADRDRGLDWTQQSLIAAHARSAVAQSVAAAEREGSKRELDALARATALAKFEAIDSRSKWRPGSTEDPVLSACQLLGQVTGIAIVKPASWSLEQSTDPIRAIARASGVRVRAVTFSEGWWRRSLEPMVAFREPVGTPVVLVPKESGRFVEIDPQTGSERPVNAEVAVGLRPTAYVMYRPLPPGALSVRGLLKFGLSGSRRDLIRLVLYSIIAGLMSLAVPIATGAILGSLVPQGSPGPIIAASVILLLVVMSTTGFLLARSASLLRMQGRMLNRMQAGLWDRLIALPVQFFGRYSVADLTMRVNGVDAIQQIVASVASQTLLALVTLVFSLTLLFFYSTQLALIVLAVTLVVVSISATVTWAQIKDLRKMYDAKGDASGMLLQIVEGVDKVRAAAAESRALGVWASKFADQARYLLSSERLSAIRTALYAALPAMLTLTVFAIVAGNPGMMSTAAFLSFITALGQISAATAQLDLSLGFALNIVPLFDRMRPVLAEPVEIAPGAADPGLLSGRVELSSVTYRYPGMSSPVLHDIDITAEPEEFIALVGPSGSGKSTLVRLLLGFDRPESGSVTYDGKDLTTLDPRAVRAQIGVALQSASVTGADILSTIIGDWPLTEDDAWAAAEKVGLADDIRALPMGMRTMLGNSAATFSGGQRQRLVLAGAIARNPRLVILDEATSALDSITQAQVAASFENLQVTRIVIAHRLSTIRNADRIIVLDKGRVAQQGSFEELAGVPGIFQNMVRRQTL